MKKALSILSIVFAVLNFGLGILSLNFSIASLDAVIALLFSLTFFAAHAICTAVLLIISIVFAGNKLVRVSLFINIASVAIVVACGVILFVFVG